MGCINQAFNAKNPVRILLRVAVVLLATLLITLAASYSALLLIQKPKDGFAKSILESQSTPNETNEKLPDTQPADTVTTSNQTEKKWPLDGLSQADAYENMQWHKDRGNFTEQEAAAYQGYSDETLQQLINTHDILATTVMADRLLDRRERNRARETYYLAAVQGSTAALVSLSILAEPDHELGETLEDRKVIHRHATIERLAIFKTLAMRGDIRGAASRIQSLKDRYPLMTLYTDGQELVLSPEEQTYIDERAVQLYDELQENRYRIGLGEFDNSTSRVEQLLYNFMY